MQTVTTAVAADLARVWAGLDEQVAAGSLPGYVAGVRHAGVTEVRAGGALALGGPGADAPMHAVGVLSTQRMMSGPHDGPDAFWHALRDGVRGTGGAGDAGAGPA